MGRVVAAAVAAGEDRHRPPVDRLVAGIVGTVRALRDNELFVRIVELDPELLLPYLLSRRGRSQDAILGLIEPQRPGRPGRRRDPRRQPDARWPARCCSPPTASCSRRTRWSTTTSPRTTSTPSSDHPAHQGARAVTGAGTRITPGLAGAPTDVDVVVIGLGVTGAGVALDAVTRGLSVLAVDAHDLAFGTSRWSSKLVHGGLRYLAQGQFGVAHESAVERGILMEVTAPHLTHAHADA